MAQKYELVPIRPHAGITNSRVPMTSAAGFQDASPTQQDLNYDKTSAISVVESNRTAENETSTKDDVINLFPKRLRSRASLLLHYVLKYLSLDHNDRVVYEDTSPGSHIVDLIRYFIHPRTVKIDRPVDAVKFALALKAKGVPDAAFSRHIEATISKVSNTRIPSHQMKESSLRHVTGPKFHPSKRHGYIHANWVRL